LNGFPDDPLPDLIYQSIQSCEIDIRKKLYSNIILSGGNSMFYGFATRIQKELIERLPTSIDLHIKTVPDRAYLSWIGGSIFSSINTFPNLWLSRKKYKESGLDTATF
ncbi:MAG: actin, cytoplasmic 2, partial [Candidatus Heimdallarchaeaceae archaeon]